MRHAITVSWIEWTDLPAQRQACDLRTAVFIREQQVPEEFEWDGLDDTAFHLLARDTLGHPVGTARMLPDGHIGRVAVVKEWRGKGVGTEMMRVLIREARKRQWHGVHLHAQIAAIAFYERLGFTAEGPEFMDAGILHRSMRLTF